MPRLIAGIGQRLRVPLVRQQLEACPEKVLGLRALHVHEQPRRERVHHLLQDFKDVQGRRGR